MRIHSFVFEAYMSNQTFLYFVLVVKKIDKNLLETYLVSIGSERLVCNREESGRF